MIEQVTASQYKELVRTIAKSSDPITLMVFGDPGIGKTFATREVAEELKRKYITLSLGRLEAFDIKGMPTEVKDDNYITWKAPVFWKEIIENKGNVIIHFDEFTLASPEVQGAILDIVQTKTLDNIELPKKVMFILSGNMGGDDGTYARGVTSALTGGRAMIVKMIPPSLEEWLDYQEPVEVIRNFMLHTEGGHLYIGPDKSDPFAPWSCPRSWSKLDELAKELSPKNTTDFVYRFCGKILSSDTVLKLKQFIEDNLLNVKKLLALDEEEWDRYRSLSMPNRQGAINMIIDAISNLNAKRSIKKVQKVLDKLFGVEPSNEIKVAFGVKLVVNVSGIYGIELKVGKEELATWVDKNRVDYEGGK